MTELSTLPRPDAPGEWKIKRVVLDGKCLLDHLFNRLDGMYPGKWKANFTGPQSIENWKDECERVFEDEGITPNHIATGLRACRKLYRDWPPSVPQFVDACMPPVDITNAYHEAVAGTEARGKGEAGLWSHPAIYWAASRLSRELMNMPSAAIKGRWEASLKAELAKGVWDEIPPPKAALPAPGASMLSKEDAAAMLAQLGALSVVRKPSDFDHLRWAKLVIERHAKGDKRVTVATIRAAREALNINEPEVNDESTST